MSAKMSQVIGILVPFKQFDCILYEIYTITVQECENYTITA